jgi:hypothetical protein
MTPEQVIGNVWRTVLYLKSAGVRVHNRPQAIGAAAVHSLRDNGYTVVETDYLHRLQRRNQDLNVEVERLLVAAIPTKGSSTVAETMPPMTNGVSMEWFRVEGSDVTEIRLRITDKVLVGFDLDELDRAIVNVAGMPEASVADKLLALEALVRAAERSSGEQHRG